MTLQLKMPFLTDLQNGRNLALRACHGQREIRSMVLAVLPEGQSKTLGNLQITLIPAADVVGVEAEVVLEAVAVAVEVLVVVQVALEVKPGEEANDSASRDDKLHEVNHELSVSTKCLLYFKLEVDASLLKFFVLEIFFQVALMVGPNCGRLLSRALQKMNVSEPCGS